MCNIIKNLKVALLVCTFSVSSISELVACDQKVIIAGNLPDFHFSSCKRSRESNLMTEDFYAEGSNMPSKRVKINLQLPVLPKGLTDLLAVNNGSLHNTANFQLTESSAIKLLAADEKVQEEIKAILSSKPINNVYFLDITEEEKTKINDLLKPYHSDHTWPEESKDLLDNTFKIINSSGDTDISTHYLEYLEYLSSLGHPESQYEYSYYKKEPSQYKEKLNLLLRSASQGYVPAFVRLYGIYEKDQNDLAMLFLKVAALRGNQEAQFKFAALHREDSSDIENETFLAVLSVMCAVGNKEAIRLKSNIENCPEMFGEY